MNNEKSPLPSDLSKPFWLVNNTLSPLSFFFSFLFLFLFEDRIHQSLIYIIQILHNCHRRLFTMRLPHHRSAFLQSFILLLSTLVSASNNVCDARVGGKSFNFESLGTPRSVVWEESTPPTVTKTTFTIDLCKPLKKLKGVPKGEDCPVGSYSEFVTMELQQARLSQPTFTLGGWSLLNMSLTRCG